jgi:chemotaxis-related protein WspD
MDALKPTPEPAAANGLLRPEIALSQRPPDEGEDCWNKIGVSGDGSCGELAAVVHCRNCPVYSAAGLRLLDRERPVDYQKYWTDYFAREKKNPAAGRLSAVVFRVGDDLLALSTRCFLEVTEPRPIHTLPHRRNGVVLGLTNVRGQLLVCVSLARLLGMERARPPARPGPSNARLLVLENQDRLVTFPVDDVQGVRRFSPEDLHPAPVTVSRANPAVTRSILMWQDRKVACLDEDSLFAALNQSLA